MPEIQLSVCTSVSTGQDVPLSLCPGTKNFFLSQCPFVPGQRQEQKSRDKLLCPGMSQDKIACPKNQKTFNFAYFAILQIMIVLFHTTSCPGFWQKNSDCPIPRPIPACPVVPLSKKIAMSPPVGNPISNVLLNLVNTSLGQVLKLSRLASCSMSFSCKGEDQRRNTPHLSIGA